MLWVNKQAQVLLLGGLIR